MSHSCIFYVVDIQKRIVLRVGYNTGKSGWHMALEGAPIVLRGLVKELLTMLVMVNLVVIFVGVPANRRRERSRCKSVVVATPARRLLFASPAQARQESRC